MYKVLVIEDVVPTLSSIKLMLEQVDYEVTVAEDGEEGVKKYDAGEFDLVITDILMPKKDGFQTIRDIRRSGKRTPILAISGAGLIGSMSYLSIAEEIGATRTLAKPFEKNEFLSAVNYCIATNGL